MATESMNGTAPSLRILCLHDGNSSAAELHKCLASLDRRLDAKHNVELVYVNSPLQATDNSGLVWWEENHTDTEDEKQYVGLDACLLHVKQVLASMPFSGLLAVGQGAALASLLPFVESLEFSIFVHGQSLLEEKERLIEEDWPVLHILDPDSEASQRLIHQFGGHVYECRSPVDTNALNVIGKFMVQQKKRLLSKCSEELVLQNQLFAVEQEASLMVAQHAMADPPAALMAAIVPAAASRQSIVGAWSGSKPFKAGGGAPCPSEFLLTRQEREQRDEGSKQS